MQVLAYGWVSWSQNFGGEVYLLDVYKFKEGIDPCRVHEMGQ